MTADFEARTQMRIQNEFGPFVQTICMYKYCIMHVILNALFNAHIINELMCSV